MGQKISVLRHESHKGSCKTHTIIIDRFYYDGILGEMYRFVYCRYSKYLNTRVG